MQTVRESGSASAGNINMKGNRQAASMLNFFRRLVRAVTSHEREKVARPAPNVALSP